MKNKHNTGLNYKEFKEKVDLENFNPGQKAMLDLRLQLLESFMSPTGANAQRVKWVDKDNARERAEIAKAGIWSFQPGSLTIVDLSCPFVGESGACSLFDICLTLFLEGRREAGRIVALDEAHKVNEAFAPRAHYSKQEVNERLTNLCYIVHDRDRRQRHLHRKLGLDNPTATASSHARHRRDAGTYYLG